MIGSYKDLQVYQKAYASALDIHRVSLTFPQVEQYELGSQMRRASKSIACNIAEGYGKRESAAEFKRYLTMALGSCDEVSVQISFCKDLGYISEEQTLMYQEAYGAIGRMLTKLVQNWQKY